MLIDGHIEGLFVLATDEIARATKILNCSLVNFEDSHEVVHRLFKIPSLFVIEAESL